MLFQRHEDDWYALMEAADADTAHPKRLSGYGRFARDVAHLLSLPALRGGADSADPAPLFALYPRTVRTKVSAWTRRGRDGTHE